MSAINGYCVFSFLRRRDSPAAATRDVQTYSKDVLLSPVFGLFAFFVLSRFPSAEWVEPAGFCSDEEDEEDDVPGLTGGFSELEPPGTTGGFSELVSPGTTGGFSELEPPGVTVFAFHSAVKV